MTVYEKTGKFPWNYLIVTLHNSAEALENASDTLKWTLTKTKVLKESYRMGRDQNRATIDTLLVYIEYRDSVAISNGEKLIQSEKDKEKFHDRAKRRGVLSFVLAIAAAIGFAI